MLASNLLRAKADAALLAGLQIGDNGFEGINYIRVCSFAIHMCCVVWGWTPPSLHTLWLVVWTFLSVYVYGVL